MISLIKTSKIPIICMCNDRNHQKIRSLANYCFDLRFQRPRVEQIKVTQNARHTCTLLIFSGLSLWRLTFLSYMWAAVVCIALFRLPLFWFHLSVQGAMMSICFKEGLKIPPPALNEIILASNQDVRQVWLTIFILLFKIYYKIQSSLLFLCICSCTHHLGHQMLWFKF